MRTGQWRRFAFVFLVVTGAVLLADHLAAQTGDFWADDAGGRTDMPTARRLLAAAALGDKVYTFGGCGSPCFQPPLHTSTFEETRVEVYDLRTRAWTVEDPMPTILFGAAAVAPGNGKIYTFGGQVSGDVVQEYDPGAKSWVLKRPMPTPRYGLAAVAHGGRIYVLGGSGPSGALEVYAPATDTWEQRDPMPTPRVFLAAVEVEGRIYAIGGSPDCCGGSQTNAVEIYDPATNSWSPGPPLPVAQQVSSAVAANGRIYVFGGFVPGFGVQSATWELDPKTGIWTSRAAMPMARDQSAAALVGQTALVLGGSVNCHCRALARTDKYTLPTLPEIEITKSDDRETVVPGDQVRYRITVSNEGEEAVQALVTDRIKGTGLQDVRWCQGEGCTPTRTNNIRKNVQLAGRSAETFFVTGTVPCGMTEVVNEACVEVPGSPPKCSSDTDRVLSVPLLQVREAGPASVKAGETASISIEVANRGSCPVCKAMLSKPAPSGLELLPSPGLCGNGFPCPLPCLDPGEAVTVAATYRVPCGHSCPGSFTSAASVEVLGESFLSERLETAVECPLVDLAISKSDGLVEAQAPQDLTYTLRVENNGVCPTGATVTDRLPAELEEGKCIGENQSDCTLSGERDLSIMIQVPAGGEVAYRVRGMVRKECVKPLSNTASVAVPPGIFDPDPGNDEATDETSITPGAGAHGTCAAAGQPAEKNAVVFTFTLLHGGLGTQQDNPGPEFVDTLPAGLTLIHASASSGTITTAGNKVSWDGSLEVCGTVTITVEARIEVGTAGTTLCNPGTVFFDADGDGVNDAGQSVTGDLCCLDVRNPTLEIPAVDALGLAALALLLSAASLRRLRSAR